ncbi:MAG TPA: ABC transporter ATP-binding protein [Methylomirabilota bacterium]|nr:ABC transporter ATP-binding protein [Methylomirabilota bacterium]
MLALRDVVVGYSGAFSVSVPVLEVAAGEVLALIGPNGSGKSTLLRVLALLQAPDEGTVAFRGRAVSVADGLDVRRRMAVVFQQPLLADMRVEDNVELGLRFRGVPPRERRTRVDRWLERLQIGALAGRPARTLSGGEAQRVALARALAPEPDVLLLDEPFGALDAPTRATLVPDLAAILRSDRVTTVIVTHDRGEAQALADRVGVMFGGRLHQVDETARLFGAPASEEVARFVGVETILAGEVVDAEDGVAVVEVGGRRVEVAAIAQRGERLRVGIRPEDVTLSTGAEPGASSARNHFVGTVVRLTAGSPVRVVLDCGFPLVAAITARSAAELRLAAGARVTAVFKASAAHVIRAGSS